MNVEKKNRRNNTIATIFLSTIGWLMTAFLLLVTGYILVIGFIGFKPEFLSTGRNGILNQLFNSFYIVTLALLIAVPIGIGAGVYLSEYAKKGKLLSFIEIAIESLTSLPSIVVGLFGYLVFINMPGMKWNIVAGSLALSILALPLITVNTTKALRNVPQNMKEGSLALGATHATTIWKVLLPAASSEILTGIVMAAGRGLGEAAALLYTAGQTTAIRWDNWNITSLTSPLNPFRTGETLALHIWVLRSEGALNPMSKQIANFAGAIFVLMTLIITFSIRYSLKKIQKRQLGV